MSEELEALQENTEATNTNTIVTAAMSGYEHPNNMKVELLRASTVLMAIVATVFISSRSPSFAENQAGIILGSVVSGYFGMTVSSRR